MPVNTDDPQLYEHLSLIIDAFEKAALRSGKREGFLAIAMGPLAAYEAILDGSESVLTSALSRSASNERKKNEEDGPLINVSLPMSASDSDLDLLSLLGEGYSDAAKMGRDYVEQCLSCDTRVTFDWQVKPLNMLTPIEKFVKDIDASLDSFQAQLDPFKMLAGICELANALSQLCKPDIIIVLMSLNLLMKRYISSAIDIKLDWTVVLGPLLKLVVDGIADLLNGLMTVISSPLDCASAALKAVNNITADISATQAGSSALGQASKIGGSIPFQPFDIKGNEADQLKAFQKLSGTAPLEDTNKIFNDLEVKAQGKFNLSKVTGLEEALKDPSFNAANFIEKLIVPVEEAKQYIKDIFDQINGALRSLGELVSGGLSISLNISGVLAFLSDMTTLVGTILRMIQQNGDVRDWCSYLQENPSFLEPFLRSSFGEVSVEKTSGPKLLLRRGPELVGEINTCTSKRSGVDQQLLSQWIKDLENGMSK